MAVRKVDWNEENLRYLRNHYKYGKIEEVAEHFGVSKMYIMKAASKYKISSGRFLTDSQRNAFEKYSDRSNQFFEKRFGCSNLAIRKMRYNYQLGTILENCYESYTCAEVGRLVGKDKSTIAKCWTKAGLPYKFVGKYKMIKHNDLLEFMKNNPKKWDATKCDYYYFDGIEWFEEKRKADALKLRQERWGEFYEVT